MSYMVPVRRIITGHSDDGKAIITSDDTLYPHDPTKADGRPPSGRSTGFISIHRTEGVPAKIQGSVEEHHGKLIPLTTTSDVTCRAVDFPPTSGGEGDNINIFHRTQSLDYGIVLKGTIQMVLDDGVETTLNEGDIAVQRATAHAWKNVSSENCRMLFVLVPSEPVKVQKTGEILEPTDISHLLPPKEPIDQS